MRRARSLLAAVLVASLGGCTVDPPPPPEEDPALQGLTFSPAERPAGRVAVSVSASALGLPPPAWTVAPVGSDEVAGVGSAGTAGVASDLAAQVVLPPREYAWEASQVDLDGVQAEAEACLRLAGLEPRTLALASPRRATTLDGEPACSGGELLARAEDVEADLLVHLDLRRARAAFVERDGLLWWFDLVMFYLPGLYPIWFVPDEVYEAAAEVRAEVVHVRSGRVLLSRTLLASARRSLNNPQRGWSLGGMLFLHPYTLDEDDYPAVFEALWPHARREVMRELLGWLRAELPARLSEPGVEALLRGSGRTWALVVGAAGPRVQDTLDRPPPLPGARSDAEAVAALLRESGEVGPRPERLALLLDSEARGERLLAAAAELSRRARAGDRLIVYYSGYGLHDAHGRAALLLDGTPLPLEELAAALPAELRVTWLLDTSFAGAGGRTWPGAPVGDPGAALRPIRRHGWDGLLAAAPGQAALEGADGRGGALTTWLVSGSRGPADEDGDGVVSMSEMSAYLGRWLTPDVRERLGAEQTPTRLSGGAASAPLVPVAAPR